MTLKRIKNTRWMGTLPELAKDKNNSRQVEQQRNAKNNSFQTKKDNRNHMSLKNS